MLQEVDDALIARLRAVLNGSYDVLINGFPGSDEEQARATRQTRIFVGYQRSRFDPLSHGTFTQTAEFEVQVMLQDIRSYKRAYPLLDVIRRALLGFWVSSPGDCNSSLPPSNWGTAGNCSPSSEEFVQLKDGTWYYSQTWSVQLTINYDLESLYSPVPGQPAPGMPGSGLPAPETPIEIRAGLWRSQVGALPDNKDESVFVDEISINTLE